MNGSQPFNGDPDILQPPHSRNHFLSALNSSSSRSEFQTPPPPHAIPRIMKPDFLSLADRALPFTAIGGRVFVSVLADNLGRRALPLHSTAFRDWFYAQ